MCVLMKPARKIVLLSNAHFFRSWLSSGSPASYAGVPPSHSKHAWGMFDIVAMFGGVQHAVDATVLISKFIPARAAPLSAARVAQSRAADRAVVVRAFNRVEAVARHQA